MAYDIKCRDCKNITIANEIVDLVTNYTDKDGHFICSSCNGIKTHIYRDSKLQEQGQSWKRYIKSVLKIDSGIPTYSPYIFLTADEEDGPITGFHFNYYKDTRPDNGKLKHGHGPGGAPVLTKDDLLEVFNHLIQIGIITQTDIDSLRNTTTSTPI